MVTTAFKSVTIYESLNRVRKIRNHNYNSMFQLLKYFAFVNSLLLLFLFVSNCISENINHESSSNSPMEAFKSRPQSETDQPSALVSMRQVLDDISELIRSTTQSFASSVPQIIADLRELLTRMAGRIMTAVEQFNIELLDAGELALRDSVRNMQQQLFRLKDDFQSLADMADEQFYGLIDYFNNTLINQTETIDLWASNLKQEMRSVNNTPLYREGCKVVDGFMRRTTDELRTCCNIAVKPVYSLCRNVRELLAEAFRVLADALERVQACLEDKKSYLEYMVPCIQVVYDDVSALVTRADQLRNNLTTMMPMKIVFSKFCILIVSVQIEQRQHEVEQVIDAKMDVRNRVQK